ncbi:MAG: acyl-CoA reductase, partial [Longimicrobiales bacterium]
MTFDAFWLPGLSQGDELITRELSDNVAIRYPALTAERVRELCRSVRARAAAARAITVQQRVRAIACATAFLRQPDNDAFEQAVALIAAATGYSIDMTRHVLLRMAQDWTEPALLELIASELGDPIVLEGPVPDGNSRRRVMAVGPQLAAHIFAGNVPGVAVTSLIRTLLLKSGAFGKTALEEPVLPVLFARSLAAVDPALAGAINVTYWPGGTTGLEEALLREADTSIVYGSRDVVSLARTSAPLNARLVIHGPRLSLGLVQG